MYKQIRSDDMCHIRKFQVWHDPDMILLEIYDADLAPGPNAV